MNDAGPRDTGAGRPVDLVDRSAEPSDEPVAPHPRDQAHEMTRPEPQTATPGLLDVPPRPAGLGWRGWARWAWRTMTSMRVALLLLALLALVAVPGSVLPQRGVGGNPAAVRRYLVDNPTVGPWLDRLGFFEVYSSAWFAAIYLLRLVSMTGCVLPRCAALWRAARADPVRAPRNLARLDGYRVVRVPPGRTIGSLTEQAEGLLRRRGFRSLVDGEEVRAEKGYLRELGNLGFHLSLLVLLVGVAVGALFGFEGRVIVAEGRGFANSVSQYDEITPGPLLDDTTLDAFSFVLDDFAAEFEPSGPQRGSPRDFLATITLEAGAAGPQQRTIAVNDPLVVGGTKVFLTGNGYAPVVTVRDGNGDVALSGPVVFLPRDGNLTSEGVVKAPDAKPTQLGFQGLFLPTADVDETRGPFSSFPAPVDPTLLLTAWTGDLGLSDGEPQSVYRLDTTQMVQVESDGRPFTGALRPGQTLTLPDGQGSITFDRVSRFANFQIASDPGRWVSLAAAVLLLGGLTTSLLVPRRRAWVRIRPRDVAPGGPPELQMEIAMQPLTRRGLPNGELDRIAADLGDRLGLDTTPDAGPTTASDHRRE